MNFSSPPLFLSLSLSTYTGLNTLQNVLHRRARMCTLQFLSSTNDIYTRVFRRIVGYVRLIFYNVNTENTLSFRTRMRTFTTGRWSYTFATRRSIRISVRSGGDLSFHDVAPLAFSATAHRDFKLRHCG